MISGNADYSFEGNIGIGKLCDGTTFLFDADKFDLIKNYKWYLCRKGYKNQYVMDCNGTVLHNRLFSVPKGYELDHISMDTLDNRSCNVRIVTHQQNQTNQWLQSNNTSGVPGVSYYSPRRKYRARIKINGYDLHLGYFNTFKEASQARNVGVDILFGEYGRKSDTEEAPDYIREKVIQKCAPYKNTSL